MPDYKEAKAHGATIAGNRVELRRYRDIARDDDARPEDRRHAFAVLMGAAQVKDPTVSDRARAVEVLRLDDPDPLTGEELVLALSRAVDSVRDNAGEPVWTPLEAVLPFEWCGGFMYMGAHEARILCGSPDKRTRKTVFMYKHGITRRYLMIGDDLQAYGYAASFCEVGDPAYTWLPMEDAIARVFEDIDQFGADRTTKYNSAFIAERNARLTAAGYTVVS